MWNGYDGAKVKAEKKVRRRQIDQVGFMALQPICGLINYSKIASSLCQCNVSVLLQSKYDKPELIYIYIYTNKESTVFT